MKGTHLASDSQQLRYSLRARSRHSGASPHPNVVCSVRVKQRPHPPGQRQSPPEAHYKHSALFQPKRHEQPLSLQGRGRTPYIWITCATRGTFQTVTSRWRFSFSLRSRGPPLDLLLAKARSASTAFFTCNGATPAAAEIKAKHGPATLPPAAPQYLCAIQPVRHACHALPPRLRTGRLPEHVRGRGREPAPSRSTVGA